MSASLTAGSGEDRAYMVDGGFPPPREERDSSSADFSGVGDAAELAVQGASDGCSGFDGCDGCGGCDLGGCMLYLTVPRLMALAVPTKVPRSRPSVPARAGLLAIRGYQRWLSPRVPVCCPHTPSCSHYGLGVVGRYGLWQGSRLAAGRISRCTGAVPRGTADPVP